MTTAQKTWQLAALVPQIGDRILVLKEPWLRFWRARRPWRSVARAVSRASSGSARVDASMGGCPPHRGPTDLAATGLKSYTVLSRLGMTSLELLHFCNSMPPSLDTDCTIQALASWTCFRSITWLVLTLGRVHWDQHTKLTTRHHELITSVSNDIWPTMVRRMSHIFANFLCWTWRVPDIFPWCALFSRVGPLCRRRLNRAGWIGHEGLLWFIHAYTTYIIYSGWIDNP